MFYYKKVDLQDVHIHIHNHNSKEVDQPRTKELQTDIIRNKERNIKY